MTNKEDDLMENPSLLIEVDDDRRITCPDCQGDVEVEPNMDEYRELTEEARLRLLKAMKVSCWRQFEQGVITEEAVQILVDYLENCEDKRFQMFHAEDMKKYWTVRGVIAWVRDKMLPYTLTAGDGDIFPEPETK
jgi:sodium/hydrogen exchanger 10/11